MLALMAAAHSGASTDEMMFIVAAVAVAAFWKALVKVGLAVLVIGALILFFSGASALAHGLHMIIP